MNRILKSHLTFLVLAFGLMLTLLGTAAAQPAPRQDIIGGARLIFGSMKNPATGREGNATSRKSATASLNEKVNDALALGNAARNRNPPDQSSAEKAYLLAWKLNPSDPRPYVGLGNLYMDQRKYAEAAKAYQDAIHFGTMGAISGRGSTTDRIGNSVTAERAMLAQWNAYRGMALLAENPRRAERSLTDAVAMDPRKAEWRAGLGYCLSLQERFSEAVRAYEKAVQLQPTNAQYELLLKEARSKAQLSSSQDPAIRRQLEGTVWEAHVGSAKGKGTCRLQNQNLVECTSLQELVPYSNLTWRVQDGLLQLIRPATEERLCVGRIGDKEIRLKCFIDNEETDLIWQTPE